ncbi:MAG: hypothetical protein ACI360_03270 [Atopobiaceae bacterium]
MSGFWTERAQDHQIEELLSMLTEHGDPTSEEDDTPEGYPLDPTRLFPLQSDERTDELPEWSWLPMTDGTRLATPEYHYLCYAATHDVAQTALLGTELCSLYVTDHYPDHAQRPAPPEGTEQGRGPTREQTIDSTGYVALESPLTCVDEMRCYLRDAQDLPGYATALTALRYVHECALTPMEAYLCTCMCLPRQLGGYDIMKPYLGARYNFDSVGLGVAPEDSGPFRAYDLSWPFKRTALQYIGSENIGAYTRRTLCADRTIQMHVVCVTAQQIRDPDAFEEAMRILGKLMDAPLGYLGRDFTAARDRLRASLPFPTYEHMRLIDEDMHRHMGCIAYPWAPNDKVI